MALEGPTPPLLTRGSIKEAAERLSKQYKGTIRMYRTTIRKVQEVLIEGVLDGLDKGIPKYPHRSVHA